jgi:hypothetical protein
MNRLSLWEARQLWRALLQSETEIQPSQWQAWADGQLMSTQTPPFWVTALSTSGSREAALAVVEHDIGLDAEHPLDPQALLIGLVVERHLQGRLSSEAMWAKLRQVVDVPEFIDSGKWREYSTKGEAYGDSSSSSVLRLLSPIASFASAKVSSLLSAQPGV